jgi:hypothetical protein
LDSFVNKDIDMARNKAISYKIPKRTKNWSWLFDIFNDGS